MRKTVGEVLLYRKRCPNLMAAARVLVVDDLPSIVSLVEVILAQQGYEVLGETSPRRALDLVRSGRQVDLIISDVVMPEMTGLELVREIRRVSPFTKAVLMSAFSSSEDLPSGVPLLHKPFSSADLLSTVERVLTEAGAALGSVRVTQSKKTQGQGARTAPGHR